MQTQKILKEQAVNNLQEALEAEKRGADRVELCTRLDVGGLSPSRKEIQDAVQQLKIPFTVMIRPREANFVYNEDEIKEMIDLIEFCKEQKVYGVVFGCLNSDSTLDLPNTQKLVDHCQNLSITFHRAFDDAKNPLEVLEKLIELKIPRLLTSGQAPKAKEGIEVIKQCVEKANGRIIIMPGSGINAENLDYFTQNIQTLEFHGSKIV